MRAENVISGNMPDGRMVCVCGTCIRGGGGLTFGLVRLFLVEFTGI